MNEMRRQAQQLQAEVREGQVLQGHGRVRVPGHDRGLTAERQPPVHRVRVPEVQHT